jgi:enoyl-CoA hydratase
VLRQCKCVGGQKHVTLSVMTNNTLLIDTHSDGVTVITFNRPETHNALNAATMQLFSETIERLTHDKQLRVLVITGAGTKAFCSGGDLAELSKRVTAEDALAMITLMGDTLLKMERLPVPVIAAINGYALGGGGEIALACDMRIVDVKARLGFVQGRQALITGWGGGQRLLRLVGYSRAIELLMRAQTLFADELKTLGLANHVVDDGGALESALQIAREIAQNPPDLTRAQKALLQEGLHRPYDEALTHERQLFPPLWETEPHWKAIDNFLNKKK